MVKTHCPAVGVPAVEPCDPAELAPLIAWLERGEATAIPLAFARGTVLPDGRLDLCKQAVGPDGARGVLDALRGHPSIRSVLLGTGAIGNSGAAAVASALGDGAALETVYLGCNKIDATGAASLATAVGSSRDVRALWLKRNPLGVAGAHVIAELIAAGRALRVLDLFNCELDDDGVAIVANALASSQIEHVYLGGNAAGPVAARALAALLASTATLRTLGLSASRLGDDGACALAAGLAQNRSLAELGVANNAIGPRGGAALALAARRLTALDLGTVAAARALGEPPNQLGDVSAPALAELIAETHTLRVLDLQGNGITSHGAMAIARAVDANTSLVELGLHYRVAKTIRHRIRARLAANAARSGGTSMPAHIAAIASVYRPARATQP